MRMCAIRFFSPWIPTLQSLRNNVSYNEYHGSKSTISVSFSLSAVTESVIRARGQYPRDRQLERPVRTQDRR